MSVSGYHDSEPLTIRTHTALTEGPQWRLSLCVIPAVPEEEPFCVRCREDAMDVHTGVLQRRGGVITALAGGARPGSALMRRPEWD